MKATAGSERASSSKTAAKSATNFVVGLPAVLTSAGERSIAEDGDAAAAARRGASRRGGVVGNS